GGTISGTPGTAILNELFTVLVRDSSGAAATKALTITIDTQSLTVTTASLPNGAVGTAYSQTLSASGGAGGNTWSAVAGSLPQGLSLSPAGAIGGTPTTVTASVAFTAQVKDSSGALASKALTITINSPTLSVTTSALPGGTAGAAYSQPLAASGGAGGYTW